MITHDQRPCVLPARRAYWVDCCSTERTAMSEVNIPLLRKAVEWVEESAARVEPGEVRWYQGKWSLLLTSPAARFPSSLAECGTTYCVAGWVCAQHPGYRAYVGRDPLSGADLVETVDGSPFRHAEVAAELLGITGRQASLLFDAGNTVGRVRYVAEWIAGEPL